MSSDRNLTHFVLTDALRREHHLVVAALTAAGVDHDVAADALQDACVAALRAWPARGVPTRPAAWLLTVARRAAIDDHRRRRTRALQRAELERLAAAEAVSSASLDAHDDPGVRVLFACCHPALSQSSRVALALHLLFDLGAPELAPLLGQGRVALAQQLVRAKRTLRLAAEDPSSPRADEERLLAARAAVDRLADHIYVHEDSPTLRRTIAAEARRLARLLHAA